MRYLDGNIDCVGDANLWNCIFPIDDDALQFLGHLDSVYLYRKPKKTITYPFLNCLLDGGLDPVVGVAVKRDPPIEMTLPDFYRHQDNSMPLLKVLLFRRQELCIPATRVLHRLAMHLNVRIVP